VSSEALAEGADYEVRHQDGATPLCGASACDRLGCVKLLLGVGASKGAVMPDGRTPLALARQGCRLCRHRCRCRAEPKNPIKAESSQQSRDTDDLVVT